MVVATDKRCNRLKRSHARRLWTGSRAVASSDAQNKPTCNGRRTRTAPTTRPAGDKLLKCDVSLTFCLKQRQKYKKNCPKKYNVVPDITRRGNTCPHNVDNLLAFSVCSLLCLSQLYCLYQVGKKKIYIYIYTVWIYIYIFKYFIYMYIYNLEF